VAEQFERLAVRIDERDAETLGDGAYDRQPDLEILLDAVDEEREVEHRRDRRLDRRIGGRLGADEHAADAEIAHRAGDRLLSRDAEQPIEVDRYASIASLFGPARLAAVCRHSWRATFARRADRDGAQHRAVDYPRRANANGPWRTPSALAPMRARVEFMSWAAL